MPLKIPEGDNTSLNMTPMIDIVFNLVTFFMLTLDLSHKELAVLDLPRATQGVEDKDPSTDRNADASNKKRFIINIEQDGALYFKGSRWRLANVTAAEQDTALDNLRRQLRELAREVKREPDGASTAMVLVRGDRKAKWRYVQWIMQVCADPQIRIYKLHFAVEHPRKE